MSRSISPPKITYQLNKSSNNITSSYQTSFISQQQDIISDLKLKVFEKGQSRKDYQNLLSRYHILKSDLEKILKAKRNNELLLDRQKNEEKNNLISKLKTENDILFEKINEQIEKNKKLYSENNLLYKEINILHCKNEEKKEQISQQENYISKLSSEKEGLEKDIFKLNEEKEKQEIDIKNYNEEINNINKDNVDFVKLIEEKNKENINIYKLLKEEKNINENLFNELKNHEINVSQNQKKLESIHKKISIIETIINNLKPTINKNYNEINNKKMELTREKNIIEKII